VRTFEAGRDLGPFGHNRRVMRKWCALVEPMGFETRVNSISPVFRRRCSPLKITSGTNSTNDQPKSPLFD
jgi:hypothetical protein